MPPNTLIAYAQRAGATAEDGTSGNSPYTTALLKHLPTPGLDVELALRRVRDEVMKTTYRLLGRSAAPQGERGRGGNSGGIGRYRMLVEVNAARLLVVSQFEFLA